MRARRRPPLAALALIVVGLLTVGALGLLWHGQRSADWKRPRWSAGEFERLAGVPGPGRELHVVAVHPLCPHCLVSLEREVVHRRSNRGAYRLAVLIVDTPNRPDDATLPGRGEDEVWWDHAGLWRHRWGHRIYGEVLMFDETGDYLGTRPARIDASMEGPPNEEPSSTNDRERAALAEKGDAQ